MSLSNSWGSSETTGKLSFQKSHSSIQQVVLLQLFWEERHILTFCSTCIPCVPFKGIATNQVQKTCSGCAIDT